MSGVHAAPGRARAFLPAVVPALVGAVLLALGHGWRAWLLLGIAQFVALMVVAGIDVQGHLARFTGAVVRAVTAVLSWSVGVVVVLPAWALHRLRRRDPLKVVVPPTGWAPVAAVESSPRRTYTTDRRRAAPSMNGGLVGMVGLVVLAMAVDVGAGVVWNRLWGDGGSSVPGAIRIEAPSEFDLSGPPGTAEDHPPDPRAKSPAMAEYPWVEEYFDEFHSVGTIYWPYTLLRPKPFRGRYINISGWERHTYRPSDLPDDAPVLAMFGGSTTFGEGQRDEYTIASHLARLAEADGLPMKVRNFGQRGWVHWQEMTLYEQLLGAGEHFDLSVFYDGGNDIAVQEEPVHGVPSHFDTEEWATRLAGRPVDGDPEPNLARMAFDWWRARSLAYRAPGWVWSELNPPAGAQEPDRDFSDIIDEGFAVYERSRALTRALSESHGVVDTYFLQPMKLEPYYERAAARVEPPVVNLTRVLKAHPSTFMDPVHTNEEGARIVAEAMWRTLRPKVQDWYDQLG